MSLKKLSESEWKKFSKARDLKDAPLLKALVALDKAEKAPPGEQLKALDELEKQADALLKAHKADKEVAAYLAELDKSLKAQRKTSEQAAKAHAESAQAESEDEDSPALLTTKMVPLMRAVPKGEVLHALVAMAGKGTVVMVARKPIPAGRRKLLAAELGVSGGIKYHAGQCLFEAKAHTFVMETVVAGLAKKIKQALLDQTEQRYKVRVRGDDPALVDDDGDEAEGDDGGSPAATAAAATAGAAIPPAPPLPPAAAVDPAKAFTARLSALMPRIKEAIAAQGASANDIKLKASEAGVLAHKKAFDPAGALLDEVEALLARAGAPAGAASAKPAAAPAEPAGAKPAAAPPADAAALKAAAKACLATWLDAKETADQGITRLQAALKASDDPAFLRIAEYGLHGVSRGLQVGMRVALAEFAQDPVAAAGKLRDSVAALRRFLEADPAVRLCDENPFGVEVALRPTLGAALNQLDQQLDALGA